MPAKSRAESPRRCSPPRHGAHQEALEPDDELRAWLADRIEKGATGDLDTLTESVQMQFPHYVRLAVCTLQSPSVDDLLQKAFEWSNQTEESFTHQAIIARTKPARLGFECVIVTGQRLPDFKPEELTRGHDKFYIICPLCRRGQACEVPPLMRSVSLECPHCHRPYAMLAVDTKGRYHHVNEYLTGYCAPGTFPRRHHPAERNAPHLELRRPQHPLCSRHRRRQRGQRRLADRGWKRSSSAPATAKTPPSIWPTG